LTTVMSAITGVPRAADPPLGTQVLHQLFFQHSAGLNEQAAVNGFVGHAQASVLGIKSNTGVDYKMPSGDEENCAATCAKMGQRVALLTSDGKVYTVTGDLVANNNAKLVPHLSHKVELTGDVTEKGSTLTIAATNLKMISK